MSPTCSEQSVDGRGVSLRTVPRQKTETPARMGSRSEGSVPKSVARGASKMGQALS